MVFERRQEVREQIALRIMLASGSIALIRDLSPHGMYFHMPLDQCIDDWMRLEFDLDHSRLLMTALGEVRRIECGTSFKGVAMRLHGLQLRLLD